MSQYQIKLQPEQNDQQPTLHQAKQVLDFIPNMYRNMVNAPGLLESYLFGYEAFRNNSAFSSAEQELIFLTISLENGCEYCLAAHSMIADKMSGLDRHIVEALLNAEPLPDARLEALKIFTQVMLSSRGRPNQHDAEAFFSAGFNDRQILDIVLAIAVKTLSNYSNHLFNTEADQPFAAYLRSQDASS